MGPPACPCCCPLHAWCCSILWRELLGPARFPPRCNQGGPASLSLSRAGAARSFPWDLAGALLPEKETVTSSPLFLQAFLPCDFRRQQGLRRRLGGISPLSLQCISEARQRLPGGDLLPRSDLVTSILLMNVSEGTATTLLGACPGCFTLGPLLALFSPASGYELPVVMAWCVRPLAPSGSHFTGSRCVPVAVPVSTALLLFAVCAVSRLAGMSTGMLGARQTFSDSIVLLLYLVQSCAAIRGPRGLCWRDLPDFRFPGPEVLFMRSVVCTLCWRGCLLLPWPVEAVKVTLTQLCLSAAWQGDGVCGLTSHLPDEPRYLGGFSLLHLQKETWKRHFIEVSDSV